MKMKRTSTILLCSSVLAVAAVMTVAAVRPSFIGLQAASTENAIYLQAGKNVLTDSLVASEGNGVVLSEKGNEFSFSYQGLSALNGGWQTLAENGTLTSITRLGRIEKVQMTLTDDSEAYNAKISWGWNSGEAVRTTTFSESEFTFDGDLPDFFTVTASSGELEIEKFVVWYQCESTPVSNRYKVLDDIAGNTYVYESYDKTTKHTVKIVDHNEILVTGGTIVTPTSFKLAQRDGSYFAFKNGSDVVKIYVDSADLIEIKESSFGGEDVFFEELERVQATTGFTLGLQKQNGHGTIGSDVESDKIDITVESDIKVSDRVIARIATIPEGATDGDFDVEITDGNGGAGAVGVRTSEYVESTYEWDEEAQDYVEIPGHYVYSYETSISSADKYLSLDAYKAGTFQFVLTLKSDPTVVYTSDIYTVRDYVEVSGWTLGGLNEGNLALVEDQTAEVTVAALPANADYKAFTVKSSKTTVATVTKVDGGISVYGKSEGTATVTVTASDSGKVVSTFTVTVSTPAPAGGLVDFAGTYVGVSNDGWSGEITIELTIDATGIDLVAYTPDLDSEDLIELRYVLDGDFSVDGANFVCDSDDSQTISVGGFKASSLVNVTLNDGDMFWTADSYNGGTVDRETFQKQ